MICLIAWEARNNPMFQQNHKCKECDATEELAQCPYCGQWVCGRHRISTGELSDGYTCNDDVFASEMWTAQIQHHRAPSPKRASYNVDKLLLGLVIISLWAALANIAVKAYYAYQEVTEITHH